MDIFKRIILFFLLGAVLIPGFSYSARIEVPELIVLGERRGEMEARDSEVYTYEDFSPSLPLSAEELLEGLGGMYVRSRGARGAQQDMGMLGAGHEQTLIMLDGIPLNDPQTGHFNMNLPLFPGAVGRMNVLSGGGSIRYGSGAMGGVVNMVPGEREDTEGISFYYGSYSSFGGEFTRISKLSGGKNFTALSLRRSGDFHPQTDVNSFSALNIWRSGRARILTGYVNKEVGAYDFYTPGWDMPSRDFSRSGLVSASLSSHHGEFSFEPSLTWRRHFNTFVLKAHDEDFYKNKHTNDVVNLSVGMEHSGLRGGVDLRRELLDSSNMGQRERDILSTYTEYTYIPHRRILLYAGLRHEEETVPRLSAAWQLLGGLKARASWGRAYRRPSFTELYYIDPANTGNENLKSEKNQSTEFGFDFDHTSRFRSSVTLFRSKYYDVIDWVGESETGPWRAENRGEHVSDSILLRTSYRAGGTAFRAGYVWTAIEARQDDYFSKYALKYLRHRFNFSATVRIAGFQLNLSGEYGVPVNRQEKEFEKLHIALRRKFEGGSVFIKLENITASSYSPVEGVPVPGRWLTVGLTL